MKMNQLAERIKAQPEERTSAVLEEKVAQLEALLESLDPPTFSSKWIKIKSPGLQDSLRKIRNAEDKPDWPRIISGLSKKWQERWKPFYKKSEPLFEKNGYKDDGEVQVALVPYKDKLYTLIQAIKPEEQDERDKICRQYINLIKKGNTAAWEQFFNLLQTLIQEWIDRYAELAVFKHDPTAVETIVRGCVQRYQEKGHFIGYLFSTLKLKALSLRSQTATSLDAPLYEGSKKTLYDYVSSPNQTDERNGTNLEA